MRARKNRILFIAPLPPPVHGSAMVSRQIKESRAVNDAFRCDWVNMSTSRRMDEIGKTTFSKPFRLAGSLFLTFWRPYRWLLPLCYKNAEVILLSWNLYPDIEKVVPRENVAICPNGIKIDESIKEDNTGNGNTIPRLLFLSNLLESKGVIVLLDALKILKDQGYSFVCDFVGGETKEIDAKRFNEEVEMRGLKDIAVYLGRKYGDEKEAAFESADIFVLPTYNDCFPLVLLEAMQHRLPCITTKEGCIPDMVKDGENGFLAEKKDPESLAGSIGKLLKDKDLRLKMGEDGYQKLMAYFTEEKFENNLIKILNYKLNL